MNNKQKIIVSVTGIFLVLLILVGLTYGYFLTKISGNNNDKSISVTTADLKLVYNDGSDGVIGGELLIPSDTEYTKTFTVKNEGNADIDYAVYLIDVVNTFVRKDDIKYTLSCTTNGTIACNGVTSETTFPSGINQLVTNTIEEGKTHTYTFKFTYKDTGTDQSVDMNKELSAKIQIFTPSGNGMYYPYEEGTLAYNIVNNSLNNTNGTMLLSTPKTALGNSILYNENGEKDSITLSTSFWWSSPNAWLVGETAEEAQNGTEVTSYDEVVGKYIYDKPSKKVYGKILKYNEDESTFELEVDGKTEKTLLKTEDEHGISYIYRGNVKDNYLTFSNKLWRIVSIQGDGTIKLALDDMEKPSNGNSISMGAKTINYNGNDYKINDFFSEKSDGVSSLASVLHNYQSNFSISDLSKMKSGDWCIQDILYSDLTDRKKLTEEERLQFLLSDSYTGLSLTSDAWYRLANDTEIDATLKCNGTNATNYIDGTAMYVGTLTADEYLYAGAVTTDRDNMEYYSYLSDIETTRSVTSESENSVGLATLSFGKSNSVSGWKQEIPTVMSVGFKGHFAASNTTTYYRPAIQLKSNVTIKSGDGTKKNPYVLS